MHRVTTMVTALFIATLPDATANAQDPVTAAYRYTALIPLKGDPKYSYLLAEIDRLSSSRIFECRNIALAARFWWDNNRVFGFRDWIGATDAVTGLPGYLGGEARAPRGGDAGDDRYEMRLNVAYRTKTEILKTFRHESAHAAGITDERAARSWAEKCH